MKEIKFAPEMLVAILLGKKQQTRRIVKSLNGGEILGYGGEVEVLAPESLRAEVAAQGRRMAAMYGDL